MRTNGRLMLLKKRISIAMMHGMMACRVMRTKALNHPSPKRSLTVQASVQSRWTTGGVLLQGCSGICAVTKALTSFPGAASTSSPLTAAATMASSIRPLHDPLPVEPVGTTAAARNVTVRTERATVRFVRASRRRSRVARIDPDALEIDVHLTRDDAWRFGHGQPLFRPLPPHQK